MRSRSRSPIVVKSRSDRNGPSSSRYDSGDRRHSSHDRRNRRRTPSPPPPIRRGRSRERDLKPSSRHHQQSRDRPRAPLDHDRDRRAPPPPYRSERRDRDSPPRRHRYDRDRDHSPSRRPRHRSRSRSPGSPKPSGAVPKFLMNRPEITEKDLEGKTEEEQEMMKMMGFSGFDTTKGKHVPGNDVSAVNVLQKRKYRQYMNRKGGFNRPLDFVA